MLTDSFSYKHVIHINIYKHISYFAQNIWNILNDGYNLLTDAGFTIYWWKRYIIIDEKNHSPHTFVIF